MSLAGFLQDGEGNFSFQRFQAFIIQTTILIVWVYISVKKVDMAPLPSGLVELSGLSFASLAAGKINETIKAIKPSAGSPAT